MSKIIQSEKHNLKAVRLQGLFGFFCSFGTRFPILRSSSQRQACGCSPPPQARAGVTCAQSAFRKLPTPGTEGFLCSQDLAAWSAKGFT